MTDGKFIVNWETGGVELNPVTFFADSTKPKVKAFLRQARQFSTEDDRKELVDFLAQAKKQHDDALSEIDRMDAEKLSLQVAILGRPLHYQPDNATKEIARRRDKLLAAIQTLEAERWGV